MKKIIYFIEFLVVEFLFIIFKVIGYKSASNLGFFIGKNFGNFFRKKKSIIENLRKSKIVINTSNNQFVNNVLKKYPIKEWKKFLFYSLGGKINIDKVLNDIETRLSDYPFNDLNHDTKKSKTYILNVNWALYCENYFQ